MAQSNDQSCPWPFDQPQFHFDQQFSSPVQPPTSNLNIQYPQLTFPTPSELLADLSRPTTAQFNSSKSNSTSQRKARLNTLAHSIGFEPTDLDTMSAHEKKRYYLEALEQYVIYVHEQLRLVHTEPVPLERVSTYRVQLVSPFAQTLLVHMEDTARKLNLQVVAEEQVFLDLRTQVLESQDAPEGLEFRRHSFAYM